MGRVRVKGRVTAALYFVGFQMTKTAQLFKLAFFCCILFLTFSQVRPLIQPRDTSFKINGQMNLLSAQHF